MTNVGLASDKAAREMRMGEMAGLGGGDRQLQDSSMPGKGAVQTCVGEHQLKGRG